MKRLGIAAIAVLLLAGAGYVVLARDTGAGPVARLDPAATGTMLYVDGDRVGQFAPGSPGAPTDQRCLRVYSAGGTTVCLRAVATPPSFEAALFGKDLTLIRTVPVDGTPSRARVSPSGRLVGWTVFRSGDSYLAPGGFSTTAGIYDLARGQLTASLEQFQSTVDGKVYVADDQNFWGVTFASDDRTFYATLASAGRTWLMRGDLQARTLTSVRENAECPSLSPDETRGAYKKKIAGRWRLHVLDLRSGQEIPLADQEHLDDQAAWQDDRTVVYARPPREGEPLALFTLPADGSGQPRLLRERAASPAPLTARPS